MREKIATFLNNIRWKASLKRRRAILSRADKKKKSDTPIFQKRKKQLILNFEKFKILKTFWNNLKHLIILMSIILIATIIFIIAGPTFKIKNVNIIRTDDLTNINIAYKSIESIRWQHILAHSSTDLLNKFQKYQENIKNIQVKTILPNTLKIIVESYIWYFNTTINQKQYIITQNGTLIPSKVNSELKTIQIIWEFDNNSFLDYKQIFKQQDIEVILNTIQTLEENIITLTIKDINYFITEKELHITLKNNTQLIYSLVNNMEKQIEKTVIFHTEKTNLEKNDIIYIDFRVKNKVFYCEQESASDCKRNLSDLYPYKK